MGRITDLCEALPLAGLNTEEARLCREFFAEVDADLARVTAERDAARARVERMDTTLASARERLTAENERLRAALETVLPEADKLRCRKLAQGEAVLGGDWDCCEWRQWHATAEDALRVDYETLEPQP